MSALDLSRLAGMRLLADPPAGDRREAPGAPDAPPVPAPPPPPPPPLAPGGLPAPSAAGPRAGTVRAPQSPALLVVDDNVRLARTVASYMEMEGFRAQPAHSAEEALLAVRRSAYDLAVVDINMPGMDGIEVCRRLREMSPGTRVLIVTGRDAADDPRRAAAAGARRLLSKPIPLATLRDEMLRVLAEQSQGQPEAARPPSGAMAFEAR